MDPYIPLKTFHDVAGVRRSCRIASETLRRILPHARPGTTTLALDRMAEACIRQQGARPGVERGFPGSICASVNAQVAHGLPGAYRLRRGDLLSLDVTVEKEGWYGDVAASVLVGEGGALEAGLLLASREALTAGLAALRAGARLGDVGAAIQGAARRRGCSVIRECVGHGIGRRLHEEPEVPHTGRRGEGLRIVPGMVLALEPALTTGSGEIVMSEDGWTFVTADAAPAAQFEVVVAVFRDRTEVLTGAFWADPPAPGRELAGTAPLG